MAIGFVHHLMAAFVVVIPRTLGDALVSGNLARTHRHELAGGDAFAATTKAAIVRMKTVARSPSPFRNFPERTLSRPTLMIVAAAATERQRIASRIGMKRPGETAGIMNVQIVLPFWDGMVTQREHIRQTLVSAAVRFAADRRSTLNASDPPLPVQSNRPHRPQSDRKLLWLLFTPKHGAKTYPIM
jgi:hypothetical protein